MTESKDVLPRWSARQVILATLFAVAVGAGFWLLYRYRLVVIILFTAIILGTAIRPLADWFVRRGLPPAFGLLATYLLFFTGLAAVLLSIVPLITGQALLLADSIPQMYLNLRVALSESPSRFLQNLGLYLPANFSLALGAAPVEGETVEAVPGFIQFTETFLNGILVTVGVFLLASFWILESDRTLRGLMLLVPLHQRTSARELVEAIEIRVGAFVRGQLILSLSIGLLALISYLIIGLPYALILALLAAIFEAIPVLGPALGAIPALLVALAIDPQLVIWVLLATLFMQALENYWLVPRVMGASVGVNPIITLLALATFASLLGLPGALLAIPIASVIQLFLDRYLLSADQANMPVPDGRDYHSALRYEVQELIGDIRKQLRKKDERSDGAVDQIEDSIEALAIELDMLLDHSPGREEPA